ncbi:hypothetical protein [Methylobacter tundripaludum]|uniref:hypothetical protein n=1 Tax=Methylobacter tundripaludum TaxID=173365 RepID=UPI000A83BE19|nr:hypothetical protein [Methylobacter tundripaludum]
MNIVKKQASEESTIIQATLKKAVANALEKKRRLGQYSVVWENNQLTYKGDDAPQITQK